MNQPFQQITILGLGLIGGSIALEAKKHKLAKRVVGYNRSLKSRRSALKRKACDAVFGRPEAAVQGSDLVILATPVKTIPKLAKIIAPHLEKGALVTDVGSTKAEVVRQLNKILPAEVNFIGGHPIAGTENSGMDSALLNLFQGRWWIFTPGTKRNGFNKLRSFARAMGAKVGQMSPREHDATLAAISHLPHMAAYGLVDTVLHFRNGKALQYAAGGFKDYTRIAASSPQMWAEICLDNRSELLKLIGSFERSIGRIKRMVEKQDGSALEKLFETAASNRRKL